MSAAFHCEIDPHCQLVLRRHWPEVPLHADITTLKAKDIPAAEVWAAGWPCQDLSNGNTNRQGLKGARSGLFYDLVDLAREVQPRWIVLENVVGLLSADDGTAFESVIDELETLGYMGGWFACNTRDVGLPHHRERIFVIATHRSDAAIQLLADGSERDGDSPAGRTRGAHAGPDLRGDASGDGPLLVQRRGGFGYTKAKGICPTIRAQSGRHQGGHSDRPIVCRQKLDVGRMREADGLSRRMDGRRGRLIGNAVSPAITEWIGRQILAVETKRAEQGAPVAKQSPRKVG